MVGVKILPGRLSPTGHPPAQQDSSFSFLISSITWCWQLVLRKLNPKNIWFIGHMGQNKVALWVPVIQLINIYSWEALCRYFWKRILSIESNSFFKTFIFRESSLWKLKTRLKMAPTCLRIYIPPSSCARRPFSLQFVFAVHLYCACDAL